jgi:hypothetical protein
MPSVTLSVRQKFSLVFLASLFFQAHIWFSMYSFADIALWSDGVYLIGHGGIPDLRSALPVHPGTPFLFLSALLVGLQVDTNVAMQTVLTFSVSGLITIISYVCFLLRPNSHWWLFTAMFFNLNKTMLDMTPPSVLAALLASVYVLLILLLREDTVKKTRSLALLGVCAGILLTMRLDTGIIFLLASLPYLIFLIDRRTLIVMFFAGLYYVAFNPFLWVNPFEHILAIIDQVEVNRLTSLGFRYNYHTLIFPFTAFFLAILYTFILKRLTTLPHDFLLWMLAASCAICALLLASPYHPVRYFFPLMMMWEIFLPLFLLELSTLIPRFSSRFPFSREFPIFLWLFLDRFPAILYIIIINVLRK